MAMSINISETFEIFGYTVDVDMSDHWARVTVAGKEISNCSGDIMDWSKVYRGQSGAALTASERKAARQYAENAIIEWVLMND
jgi:hypothetical protein